MSREIHKWRAVKAKIIVRYGTLARAAGVLDCSVEGIKQAVKGRCPGIATKLREHDLLAA